MSGAAGRPSTRWLAPEVVQTSAMDCGPASLKCLLDGFGIPAAYGRLREACQTDVDGTSIDVIEVVARRLGLDAEQVMVPVDHLLLPEAACLPAMAVVRQPDGATHFVVVWRRVGRWLQLMDPAVGRRWSTCEAFFAELFRHRQAVPTAAWREWAGTEDFLGPLRARLRQLRMTPTDGERLIDQATADPDADGLAGLDAAVRMVKSLIDAGGLAAGNDAARLVAALVERLQQTSTPDHRLQSIPADYWIVTPTDPDEDGQAQRLLQGAVLLRVKGVLADDPEASAEEPLSPELAAALHEPARSPWREIPTLLKQDGVLTLLVLLGVSAVAVGGVLIETLLFRGLFDVAWQLNLAQQRLGALLGVMSFGALLMAIELPIALEGLRMGRHLETRLRMALLRKLPRLNDRYFHSRPISDMADRGHSLVLARHAPGLAIQLLQVFWDLAFTLAAIALIDPPSIAPASCLAALAVLIPLLVQPWLNEQDLRVRSHSGALQGFYLDALLGLIPIRTHRAERAVRREHEGLLVEWVRAGRALIRWSVLAEALQALLCIGLAACLLMDHFERAGISGNVLLLVYWTLKLPALGHKLTDIAHQYPAQRNVMLRLLEPLSAPEDIQDEPAPAPPIAEPARPTDGVSIELSGASVVAAGHPILSEVALRIEAGEHVAIVGPSGAGKSTLLGLLLGWHRLAEGELRVDGDLLSAVRTIALRQQTAWVDPAIQIWNRPFLDNLAYCVPEPPTERLAQVIDQADLRCVLQTLPIGLQTPLGEGGALLSGGQGQRVRLGRAMLQRPVRLALLDEPFRGLDRGRRRELLAQAREHWSAATLLCVTHDVSETLSFDRVLVIDKGRIVEDGAPSTLAIGDSLYRQLLESEAALHRELWEADWWRRIRVEQGRLIEETA